MFPVNWAGALHTFSLLYAGLSIQRTYRRTGLGPWHSRHDSSSRSCLHHTCNSAHPTPRWSRGIFFALDLFLGFHITAGSSTTLPDVSQASVVTDKWHFSYVEMEIGRAYDQFSDQGIVLLPVFARCIQSQLVAPAINGISSVFRDLLSGIDKDAFYARWLHGSRFVTFMGWQ